VDALRGLRGCSASSEAELRAWTGTIARRRVANLMRREEPRVGSAVPLTALRGHAETTAADPSPNRLALLAALANAVSKLSPVQSRLLWMRLQADATWQEVGEDLGIGAAAAKRRYQRLTVSLRRRCGAQEPR